MPSTRNKIRHHLYSQPLPSGGFKQAVEDAPASHDAVNQAKHARQAASADHHS